jgi:UDP-N-acetylmuramate--alanine ligase
MKKHYHLVGVAGSGMNALAQLALAEGHTVSGSDRDLDTGRDRPVLSKLAATGVALVPQDGSGVTEATTATVVSTAIESDNPDIASSERYGVPILHRAELLESLLTDKRLIGVAGTCGKTTVTAMLGWVLEQLGADPTVVNGGAVLNWASETTIGNVRVGSSNLCVAELDESDRSLLRFEPESAIVTNIAKDHFDVAETAKLFDTFRQQVKGPIVGPGIDSLPIRNIDVGFPHSSFVYDGIPVKVPIPGRHNVENAAHVLALCCELGFDLKSAIGHLSTFQGVERRLQMVGSVSGAAVIDDFAHNPSKIEATLDTLIPHFTRVIAVWRPHGFRPLEVMHEDLVELFVRLYRPDDEVVLLPVYYAGGTVNPVIDSRGFVAELIDNGIRARLADDPEDCVDYVRSIAGKGEAVVVMGARDPSLPVLARGIVESRK